MPGPFHPKHVIGDAPHPLGQQEVEAQEHQHGHRYSHNDDQRNLLPPLFVCSGIRDVSGMKGDGHVRLRFECAAKSF